MICSKCGNPISPNDTFCSVCGNPIENSNSSNINQTNNLNSNVNLNMANNTMQNIQPIHTPASVVPTPIIAEEDKVINSGRFNTVSNTNNSDVMLNSQTSVANEGQMEEKYNSPLIPNDNQMENSNINNVNAFVQNNYVTPVTNEPSLNKDEGTNNNVNSNTLNMQGNTVNSNDLDNVNAIPQEQKTENNLPNNNAQIENSLPQEIVSPEKSSKKKPILLIIIIILLVAMVGVILVTPKTRGWIEQMLNIQIGNKKPTDNLPVENPNNIPEKINKTIGSDTLGYIDVPLNWIEQIETNTEEQISYNSIDNTEKITIKVLTLKENETVEMYKEKLNQTITMDNLTITSETNENLLNFAATKIIASKSEQEYLNRNYWIIIIDNIIHEIVIETTVETSSINEIINTYKLN